LEKVYNTILGIYNPFLNLQDINYYAKLIDVSEKSIWFAFALHKNPWEPSGKKYSFHFDLFPPLKCPGVLS